MTTVQFRYEMRRECQEILPGLFLGPFVASKSLETLSSLKVSHMYVVGSHFNVDLTRKPFSSVCIRDAKEAFSVRPRFPDNFSYMVLDVEDNEEQNLIRLFPA
jgi:serine/threonine/tyrosine-interacting protein